MVLYLPRTIEEINENPVGIPDPDPAVNPFYIGWLGAKLCFEFLKKAFDSSNLSLYNSSIGGEIEVIISLQETLSV